MNILRAKTIRISPLGVRPRLKPYISSIQPSKSSTSIRASSTNAENAHANDTENQNSPLEIRITSMIKPPAETRTNDNILAKTINAGKILYRDDQQHHMDDNTSSRIKYGKFVENADSVIDDNVILNDQFQIRYDLIEDRQHADDALITSSIDAKHEELYAHYEIGNKKAQDNLEVSAISANALANALSSSTSTPGALADSLPRYRNPRGFLSSFGRFSDEKNLSEDAPTEEDQTSTGEIEEDLLLSEHSFLFDI